MNISFKELEMGLEISSEKIIESFNISVETTSLEAGVTLDCDSEYTHQITIDEYLKDLEEQKKIEEQKKKSSQKYSAFMEATFERDDRLLKQEQDIMKRMDLEHPYKSKYEDKSFCTRAERQFYNFIKENIILKDKVNIFAMVRLADIIDIEPIYKKYVTNKEYTNRLYNITSKHVDILVCRADNYKIICAYELDDYTHNSAQRQKDDAFKINALQASGIKMLRYVKPIANIQKSDLSELNVLIGNEFAPKCSKCNEHTMVTKQRSNDGKYFFACFDNFNCRHTEELNVLDNKEDTENGKTKN